MAEPYLGEIRIFPFMFAPRNWTECNGQVLPVSQNQALYSLLGNNYGGSAPSTFALPNLQSRVPMHMGNGSNGLTPRMLAQTGGMENTILTENQLPPHTHPAAANTSIVQTAETSATLKGTTDGGNAASPEGANLASGTNIYRSSPRSLKNMAETSIAMTQPTFSASTTVTVNKNGGGVPGSIPTVPPFLVLRFCIALDGLYPSRN